ncbi:MAG TPA: hypothetical protein VH593_30970, partial [Ktedonobacteraceae bacterium]
AISIILLDPAIWLVQIGVGRTIPTTLSPLQLAGSWGMGALALGTTVSSLLEALALLWLLRNQLNGLQLRRLLTVTLRILMAVVILCVMVLSSHYVLDLVIRTPNVNGQASMDTVGAGLVALKLSVSIALGALVYLCTARMLRLLGGNNLRQVNRLLVRLRLSWI